MAQLEQFLRSAAGPGGQWMTLKSLSGSLHRLFSAAEAEAMGQEVARSICISNTDDHLRNHGFLQQAGLLGEAAPWVACPRLRLRIFRAV